jgi:hypothetical protein
MDIYQICKRLNELHPCAHVIIKEYNDSAETVLLATYDVIRLESCKDGDGRKTISINITKQKYWKQ